MEPTGRRERAAGEAEGNRETGRKKRLPPARGPGDEEGRAREGRRAKAAGAHRRKRLSPVSRPTLVLPPTLLLVILPPRSPEIGDLRAGRGKHGVQLGRHYKAYVKHRSDVS